jgi:O-antigen ligase
MIYNVLLALGVVLSSATQISVPGYSITIGEFTLLLWCILSLGRVVIGGQVVATPALARLGSFWIGMALLLSLGTIFGYMTKVLILSYVLHDSTAYVLLALVSCLIAARPDTERHLHQTAWLITAFASVALAIQVAQGWGVIGLGKIDPWYWDRFMGWSQNPNQLALYCAIYGPLALHLATTATTVRARVLGLLCMILSFIVGRLTKSDTYLLATVLACLVFLALRLRTWLSSPTSKSMLARQVTILMLLTSLPLAFTVQPLVVDQLGGVWTFATGLTRAKGGAGAEVTAVRRLQLWNEAFEQGLQSASFGLGPGAHLESRPLSEPFYAITPFEAHNTYLDMFLQGGLMATLLLLWIGGTAAVFAWRAKLDALFALVISIAIFSFPHLAVRHPIVWFAIALCLVSGTTVRASSSIAQPSTNTGV